MPLYEYRRGGTVVERVLTAPGSHEDQRLTAAANRSDGDGWYRADVPTDQPDTSTTKTGRKTSGGPAGG